MKIKEQTKVYNENQRLLKSLQQDNEKWEKRLEDVQGKAKEVSDEKKTLQDSLGAALLCHKDLEKEASEITSEVVYAYGVYFDRTKEKVLFRLLDLDLSLLDFLKVVQDGVLVD